MHAALKRMIPSARVALGLALGLGVLAPLSPALAQAPKIGPNINMVTGTRFPEGDPFLTKQNEPSIAVSSRNPRHLLAASNDYRQIPVLLAEHEDGGDAWNTLYKSVDGGTTWRAVALGGCLLNIPACNDPTGLTAGIKALAPDFTADPTVRPGPYGTFFYSFISGIRDVNTIDNVVAVQRFVDKNNDIQRDTDVRRRTINGVEVDVLMHAEDPILPDKLSILDHGNIKKFIDKPWNAVDIGGRPWNSGKTCNLLSWTKPAAAGGVGDTVGVSDASETVPAFSVYVAYSIFSGVVTATDKHPKIAVVSSSDCGTTFSAPVTLSHEIHASQGASMAVDPLTGTVYVVWRSFGTEDDSPSESEVDRIYMNRSTDGGKTWLENPIVVAVLNAYDQAATGNSFRTLGFPSVAVSVDAIGQSRVHVVYTARNAGVNPLPPYACQSNIPKDCDARVRITTSLNGGSTWSSPVPVDPIPSTPINPDGRGHQVQPTLTFAAGKLAISWLDQRFDQTEEILVCPDGKTCTQVTDLVRARQPMGNLDPNCAVDVTSPPLSTLPQAAQDLLGPTPGACYEYRPGRPASVWTTYLTDGTLGLVRRHTVDVFAALADPADAPAFTSSQVSQYLFGSTAQDTKGNFTIRQKEVFAPNLPLYAQGTAAFVGDYIDVSGRSIVATSDAAQRYKFDIGAICTSPACASFTTSGASPVFHLAFTDNRDVIPPADGDWTKPACIATEFTGDPANPINSFGSCATPGFAGNRNQNVRSAIVAVDSVEYAYSNSKLLSASTPRGFVLTVENLSDDLAGKMYRMSVNNPPSGVTASFDKTTFDPAVQCVPGPAPCPLLMTDVMVQPRSSATRTLWITSSNDTAARLVVQITSPPGCNSGIGCYTSEIALNPEPGASQSLVGNGDGTALDLTNNDMGSVVLSNAVLTNNVLSNRTLGNGVLSNGTLNSVALSNNALTNAVLSNVVLSNAVLSNLEVENLNPVTAPSAAVLTNNVLTNAALSNVVLTNAVLTNLDPYNVALSNLALSNNALSNAVLSNAALSNNNPSNLALSNLALSNAVLSNNALSNLALTNLDPANLALSNAVLSNNALSNVALSNNALSNVVLTNAALTNAVLTNVALSNNALSNNALSNNALSNLALSNNALSNLPPDTLSDVELANFDLGKNAFTSTDLANSQFADATFTVRNRGNTDTTLTIKLLLRDATNCDPVTHACTLPDGAKIQLVMRKIVPVPTAIPPTDPATSSGRALRIGLTQFSAQVSNVGTPDIVSPDAPDLGSFLPSQADAPTLPLGPGERAYITLRAIGTTIAPSGSTAPVDPFEFLRWGAKTVVADAAQPKGAAIPLVIKTLSLPQATALTAAIDTVSTVGGTFNLSGTAVCADQLGNLVTSPCLPSPVSLAFNAGSHDGALTFTPSVKGTFYLLVTVTDQSVPMQTDRQLLKVVVNAATQTITFANPGTVVFGSAPFTISASALGGTVTFNSLTTGVCTITGNLVTLVAAGTCTITADQSGNDTYAQASQVSQTFTVNMASQTINFAALGAKTFGDAPFAVTATATSGLPVSFTSGTASVCTVTADGSVVTLLAGGTCTITAGQAGNANYNAATAVSQNFTVNQAAQTINFAALVNRTFGSGSFAVTATATSGLPVSFTSGTTSVCTVTADGSVVTLLAGGTCTITASQAGNANYSAASPLVSQSFTVIQATQTINFAALVNRTFGSGSFAVTATATSGLPVSFTSGTTSVCTVTADGSVVTLLAGGTCTITASQAGNANYSAATSVQQSFTVNLASQTITVTPPATAVVYNRSPQTTVTLTASASSGLAVTFASTTSSVCTVSGNIATIVAAGTCTITANQTGIPNYNPAPQVTFSFKVAKGNQNVSCDDVSSHKVSDPGFTVHSAATSGLAPTLSSLNTSVCKVSGNTVTLVGTGTCTIAADQYGNNNWNSAQRVKKVFTVTP